RPFLFRRDRLGAGPGEAGAADTDAVAHRLAVALHQIEELVRRIDHDRAGAFIAVIIDHLLVVLRVEAALGRLGRLLSVHALLTARHAPSVEPDIRLLLVHRLLVAAALR